MHTKKILTYYINNSTEGIADIMAISQTTAKCSTLGEINFERKHFSGDNKLSELLLAPDKLSI